jgi:hypothetical protein
MRNEIAERVFQGNKRETRLSLTVLPYVSISTPMPPW